MQSIVDAMSNVAVSVKDKVAGAAASVKSSGPSNSVGKIHTYPDNYRVIRAQTVAAMNGFSVDVAEVTMGTTNKTPEFLAKFPAGKVPAFEGTDGCCIEQTSAIAHYLAQLNPTTDLLGHSTQEAAQVQSWVAFADEDLSTKVAMLKGMIKGYVPYSAPIENYLFNTIMEKHLPHLNQYLETNTFLVGERISLADLTMTSVLAEAFTVILGENERTGFNHVMRYYNTMVNQPTIMSFYECKKTLLAERQKASPPKKEAKPKAAPAAAAAKPKAQPKTKAQDDEEEEDLVPKEAAVKSPLDLLPPSAFKLDDLKRHYSNNETRGPNGTIEWFYKNCDFEGYSVWKVDYKYPEDLSLIFMSNNLLGGFFNRLEASRKYLFGNFAVCGVDNNNNIHGVFVCRGQDIMIPIQAAPDWESYEFTKLDLSVYEDKKYFEDAMADELSVKGRAYADGKTFK